MKHISLILATLSGGLWCVWSQSEPNKKLIEEKYRAAEALYALNQPTAASDSQALQLYLAVADQAASAHMFQKSADAWIKAGNIHQTYQRYDEANQHYHHALQITQDQPVYAAQAYAACLYMGSSFYFNNIIDSAQWYLEKAAALVDSKTERQLPDIGTLYNSLGSIYFESANYLQAKNYFEKALQVTQPNSANYQETYVSFKSNIATCLLRTNQLEAALNLYRSLDSIEKGPDLTAILQQNTAHTLFELGRLDEALAWYDKIGKTAETNQIKALNDIGRIYMEKGAWNQAEIVFDSAIAVNRRISPKIKNKEEAKAYLFRGQLAAKQHLMDEAIIWCNQALAEIHLNFPWSAYTDLPDDITQSVSPITLFDILQTKAAFLYQKYQDEKNESALQAAVLTYDKAISTAAFIKRNFDNDEAKLFFNTAYRSIYDNALQTALKATQIKKENVHFFLRFIEQYKGNILFQNLQSVANKSTDKFPDSVLRREKELKQLIAFYTSKINSNAKEGDALKLQERLIALQIELSRHQQKSKLLDPALNPLETDTSYFQLKNIQSKLTPDQSVVHYFLSDSLLYLFCIQQRDYILQEKKTDSQFQQNLILFQRENHTQEEGRRYQGQAAAAALYPYLIEPIEPLLKKSKQWILIPDGDLYYLPFEALLKDASAPRYLVTDFRISYHYSISLLLQEKSSGKKKNEGLLSMAPFAQTGNSKSIWAPLPYSARETHQVGATRILNDAATKARFLELAGRHSSIHLATHASMGQDSLHNWIQFYPHDSSGAQDRLYLPEIYQLDLHRSSLVVLSACETGGGTKASGEGLTSLARAFLYAGCDGIIATLWKTEDKVTALIMDELNRHLESGLEPERALHEAKKSFLLQENIDPRYKTPNYWSSFQYTGQVQFQVSKAKYRWPMIWISALCLGLVILLQLKKGFTTRKPFNVDMD